MPTNPRFTWPEEVREAQRAAMDAIDKVVRLETAAELAWEDAHPNESDSWGSRYADKPGTIMDDLNEAACTGFMVVAQYQFMEGDAEDSLQMYGSSGTLTKAAREGLVRAWAKGIDVV